MSGSEAPSRPGSVSGRTRAPASEATRDVPAEDEHRGWWLADEREHRPGGDEVARHVPPPSASSAFRTERADVPARIDPSLARRVPPVVEDTDAERYGDHDLRRRIPADRAAAEDAMEIHSPCRLEGRGSDDGAPRRSAGGLDVDPLTCRRPSGRDRGPPPGFPHGDDPSGPRRPPAGGPPGSFDGARPAPVPDPLSSGARLSSVSDPLVAHVPSAHAAAWGPIVTTTPSLDPIALARLDPPPIPPWITDKEFDILQKLDTNIDFTRAQRLAVQMLSKDPSRRSSQERIDARLQETQLLRPFHDGLNLFHYVSVRKALVQFLYSYYLTHATKDEAESAVVHCLLESLAHFSTITSSNRNKYEHLGRVHMLLEAVPILSTYKILCEIDRRFVPTSPLGSDGLETALKTCTLGHGFKISELVPVVHAMYRTFRSDQSDRDNWTSSVRYILTLVVAAAEGEPLLTPIMGYINQALQAGTDCDSMVRMLGDLEAPATISAAIDRARARAAGNAGGGATSTGGGTPSLSEAEVTKRLDKLQSAVAMATKSIEAITSSSSTGSMNEGLSAPVRITDEEWQEKWGVKGQAPPFRWPRPPLWYAKCAQVMNLPMPDDLLTRCPRDKLLGNDCPLCSQRGISDDMWFIQSRHKDFDGRHPPPAGPERKLIGWKHTLGDCPKLRDLVHRYVRQNPTSMHLFDPLPEGQEPASLE